MRLNKDNVINALCIFGIIVAICFMLIVMLKSFYGKVIDVAFIKDIFSIGTTLFAALIAISLFNDWKEQQKHQNSIQFGIEVYAGFKKFDECYSEICKELTFLEYQLKEVLNNNENNLRSAFLINSSKTSKRNHELFNHYLNFQDSYTNYCIVTNQEVLLIDIEYTRDSLIKFYTVLTDIQFENSLEVTLQKILFLNSEPVNQIGTYIYNYYIKQMLEKIRL